MAGDDARLATVALALVLGLGLILRLVDIGVPFYGYHMWNEVYYATIARNFDHFGLLNAYNYDWKGGTELGQRLGPSPFVPWLIRLSFHVFGESEAAARLPVLLLGMLSLLAIYSIARELYDRQVALIACFLAAIMPGVVFMSRQVALDGPMVAFGLSSVWALLRARREQRLRWMMIGASSLLLGTAVFIKYTGVLFVPLLAWIWLGIVRQEGGARPRYSWLLAGTYFMVAALPAIAWMARGFLASTAATGAGHSQSAYLLRTSEWDPGLFKLAIYSIWVRTSQQTGQILWYPLVLAAVLLLPGGRMRSFVKQNVEVTLIILPWFVQLVYPKSWYTNDAYTYPALYGMAILLALLVRRTVRTVHEVLMPSDGRTLVSAALVAAVLVFASRSDYRQYYHSWYVDRDFSLNLTLQLPANLIDPDDPFASASLVRSLNVSHAPILADLPATLYYAQDEPWRGKGTWYWWPTQGGLDSLLRSIQSLDYAFVVFTYQPHETVVRTLCKVGYNQIGPGAWQRPDDTPQARGVTPSR